MNLLSPLPTVNGSEIRSPFAWARLSFFGFFFLLLLLLFTFPLFPGASSSVAHAACATPPGDFNQSGKTDITDVQCNILFVLYYQSLFAGNPPNCAKTGTAFEDLDCNGVAQVADLILLIKLVIGEPLSETIDANQNLCADSCEQSGNCCGTNITPGCSNNTCEACVCALNPKCCTGPWGNACNMSAIVDCQEECGCVPTTADQCCAPHVQPGCGEPECQQCVCLLQPECCTGAWNDSCVAIADAHCPDQCGCKPDLPCDAPHSEPGCGLLPCETCVCTKFPFCCMVEWTQTCAEIAFEDCTAQCNTNDFSPYMCNEPKTLPECGGEWCSECSSPELVHNSPECCMGSIWSESFDQTPTQVQFVGNDVRYQWHLDPSPPQSQQDSALALKYTASATAPYPSGTYAHAMTGSIHLPPDTQARVSFNVFLSEKDPNEYPINLRVRVGQTETVVWSTAVLSTKPLWHKVCVRLDSFAGHDIVLQWSFAGLTFGTQQVSAFFVDDVVVRVRCDDVDSDGDGLPDLQEGTLATDPTMVDTDGDGLPDGFEVAAGLDPTIFEAVFEDQDGDGLDTLMEATLKTDPLLADTDGDGLDDGLEWFTVGTDPTVWDTDGDGLSDGHEVLVTATLPLVVDSDAGGRADGAEVNEDDTDPLNAVDDAVCGNGMCDGGDACGNCEADCGPCPICDPKGCGDKSVESYQGNIYGGGCSRADGSAELCNDSYYADDDGQYHNCFFTPDGCENCVNEQQQGCKNTCPQPEPPECTNDPKRLNFAGFESELACKSYGNSYVCNQTYFADIYGPRSCYWDAKNEHCLGCTTWAEYIGLCADQCGPGKVPSCEGDPSRTIYLGGYLIESCILLNGNPQLCEQAYETSTWGVASCYYDPIYKYCQRCVVGSDKCINTCATTCVSGIY